ncbi:MAG: hypothetical protein KME01_07160 [Chroococcus sp. CMT-3BRIN-NPC107]|jgi:hypothetical protein|nr:hypothetical protein [Chroococcus sp. CMT-3BRIN-NPC107]
MKNFITCNARRSPLQKGGKDIKVPLKKGDLGRSLNAATYSQNFQIFPNQAINFGWLLLLTNLLTTPANAHKIETYKDVGATIHIEPNDSPRAGEIALAWFALTHKGGKIIPLDECNCKLSLYSQPLKVGTAPISQPPLKAVSQESYRDIPGAEITFPAAGAYQLQLQGSPKAGAKFSAFELKFDIDVAPGVAAPKSSDRISTQISPQEPQTTPPWLIPAVVIGAIFTGAIAFLVGQKLHRKD